MQAKTYVVVEQKGDVYSPLIIEIERKRDEEIHRVNAILGIWCNTAEEAFKEGERYLRR